jgi:LacI family transcriptional regulator
VRYGISESTLERVLAAVRDLGYRPNRSGRGLRTLRRSIIGIAIVDPSPTFLADPFTTHLVAGLSNYLSGQGYGLLLHGIKPKQVDASFLVKENVVDGLCIVLSGSPQLRRQNTKLFNTLSHPMVVFQDSCISDSNRPHECEPSGRTT